MSRTPLQSILLRQSLEPTLSGRHLFEKEEKVLLRFSQVPAFTKTVLFTFVLETKKQY